MEPVIAVLPCRAGSERVKYKNTRPFSGFQRGLLELKLKQLLASKFIDKIIVSSNDEAVLQYVSDIDSSGKLTALERPQHLGISSTPMSEFIRYAADFEKEGVMLMTHVTHPFIKACDFDSIIAKYHEISHQGYDSLLTVTKLHKFIWDENGAFNYDDTYEKWPRSQDIKPLFEINHGAYLIPFALAREVKDRVGKKPYFMDLSESLAMDIDWEDQFRICEDIMSARLARGEDVIN